MSRDRSMAFAALWFATLVALALLAAAPAARAQELEPLVPELAGSPFRIDPGPREFQNRLTFSPAWGRFGTDQMFAARVAYHPGPWLGYEGSISHLPGESVHAVLHTLSALVRAPLPGRFQPYATAGYGMIMVFPGRSLNADPVTKNALSFGAGLELFLRNDLALRGEVRNATVIGRDGDQDGLVAYQYLQQTIGLAFHRSIRP